MRCNKCGTYNSEGSNFCENCGVSLYSPFGGEQIKGTSVAVSETITDANYPFPYVISLWKFLVLDILTLGIFEIYWFYKHQKAFTSYSNKDYSTMLLWVLALFSPVTSYSLFKTVSVYIKAENQQDNLQAGILSIVYFVLRIFSLGFLPLLIIQSKINKFWVQKYPNRLVRSGFGLGNWVLVLGTLGFWAFVFSSAETIDPVTNSIGIKDYNQQEVVKSVVNIICQSTKNPDETSGGSGTLITKEGAILTSAHIFPQDDEQVYVEKEGCLVTLPNQDTGQAEEIYVATPFVVPGVSDKYDLALLYIDNAYYDDAEGKYWGVFPRTFPAFDDKGKCKDDYVRLGEPIRVFGYPELSGGYDLTITDGVVSSISNDGLIYTSAKISHGNSGGLAVDKNGCMVGIPSMISTDENESLGVIYSMDLVNKFADELNAYIGSDK